jgi:Golgi apparatus protein 1
MKQAFEESLSVALLESQLAALETRTGVPLLARDTAGRAQGVTLTGWSALAGIAALVVMLLTGMSYAWRQYHGGVDPATVVLKSRAGYKRVSVSAS